MSVLIRSCGRASAAARDEVRLRDLGVRQLWPLWAAVALLTAKALSVLGGDKVGIDAHAYWLTGHHSPLYWRAPAGIDAYLYSPAFAQVIRPLTWLPYPAFYALWVAAESAAFIWLLRPLGLAWGVPALLLCAYEIVPGNITGFVAVAVVLGMTRWPQAWTFVLLTKPTLVLGPVWYLARKDWRSLRRLVAAVLIVVAASAVVWPSEWPAWVHFLFSHRGQDPSLPYRVAAAWLLAAWAARRNRPALLILLMVLASPPTLAIGEYVTLFAALPRLRALGRVR